MEAGPPPAPRFREAAIVGLLAVAASANTLGNGFVYDDNATLVANPWIRDWGHLAAALQGHLAAFDPSATTTYYRPLIYVLHALVHSAFGMRAWGFHALNLALHLAVSLCVLALLHRCRGASAERTGAAAAPRPSWGPLAGAVLFAVHPIHTEAVAWSSGVAELSYSLFGLLALLVATRGTPATGPRLAAAAALFLAALLCKEPAVAFLPSLALLLLARGELGSEARPKGAALTLAGFAGAAAVYLGLRAHALGGLVGPGRPVEATAWESAATGLALFGRYVTKLVAPLELSALHDFRKVTSLADQRLWLGAVLLAAAIWAGLRFRQSPGAVLGLSLLVFPLLPALYLPGLGEGLFAERYLYLPSVGAALLASTALESLGARKPLARASLTAVAVVALAFTGATVRRNAIWRDDLTLFGDVVEKVPASASAWEGLGTALHMAGRHQEAVATFGRAIALNPALNDARINLASSLCVLGRFEEAFAQLGVVLARSPEHPEANAVLGWALMATGQLPQAIGAYQRALERKPALPRAHNALGIAYAELGDFERAERHFREAVRLDPANADFQANLRSFADATTRRRSGTPPGGSSPAPPR